jgi:putative ABC transport system ATP-binding protein
MTAPPAPEAMIAMRDLRFGYPQGGFELVVDDFCVSAGERVAVVGPSGSGKTTLLHLAAGIAVPAAGRVHTRGVEVSSLGDDERRRFRVTHIGYVFQGFELLEYLDVLDNVLLPYRVSPALTLSSEVVDRASELATSLGIGDKLSRRADQLSFGEQQRAAVCRALVTQPDLILADEPTGNLDVHNKHRVLETLQGYAKEHRATLVAVTHDVELLDHFERVVDFASLTA